MTDQDQPAEIVAIAYGGIDVALACVSVEMWVRVRGPDGKMMVGTRDPILTHYGVLAAVSAFESELMSMVTAKQPTREAFRPVSRPLPAWDQGPDLRSEKAYWWWCQGWGYADVDADIGAVRMWLETSATDKASSTDPEDREGAEYLIAYHSLPAYHRGLRNVLRKMEAMGVKVPDHHKAFNDAERPPPGTGIN